MDGRDFLYPHWITLIGFDFNSASAVWNCVHLLQHSSLPTIALFNGTSFLLEPQVCHIKSPDPALWSRSLNTLEFNNISKHLTRLSCGVSGLEQSPNVQVLCASPPPAGIFSERGQMEVMNWLQQGTPCTCLYREIPS